MADYAKYLNSAHWKKTRERMLEKYQHRCFRCGSPQRLEVHHLTYERIGEELDRDLVVLCHVCHRDYHKERECYDEVNAFMKVVYGEEWEDSVDFDRAKFEYHCWFVAMKIHGPQLDALATMIGGE